MINHVEINATTASTIPKSMCCSYEANFKLIVIKYTHRRNQQLCYGTKLLCYGIECTHWTKQKEGLSEAANPTRKTFHGPKQGNFNANDKKVLGFVL